jgi:hypothetical protein
MAKGSERCYHRLLIRASLRTDIWLADGDGHLVQKERGTLDTSLLPGHYVVEFGLGTQTYPIHLVKDTEYSQAEIEAGPLCPRPAVKLVPLYTPKQGQYLAFIYYFTKIHGEAPSEAEMQRHFRWAVGWCGSRHRIGWKHDALAFRGVSRRTGEV